MSKKQDELVKKVLDKLEGKPTVVIEGVIEGCKFYCNSNGITVEGKDCIIKGKYFYNGDKDNDRWI